MRRLQPGRNIELKAFGGEKLQCRVIAVAGTWVLLTLPDKTVPLPDWLGDEVFLEFFENVYPVRLKGRIERGSTPGDLRFTTTPTEVGHQPEPRSAPRVPVSLSASVLTADGNMVDSEVLDISAGGMKLRYHTSLPEGGGARIVLQLPDGPLIDADLEVNHLRPGTASVRFTHFHAGTSTEIAEWCVDKLRGPDRAG